MIEFRVGMQPGNNYRVAAALVGDEGDFASLQVANPGASFYVPSGDGQISFGGIGALSPMLTVWRKLHLEFDSMSSGPPISGEQANTKTGTVLLSMPDSPVAGRSTLIVDQTWALESNNRFEWGCITIDGVGDFEVIKNEFSPTYGYQKIVVYGNTGTGAANATFVIRDDDDKFLNVLGLPPPLQTEPDSTEIVNAMQAKFAPAYIKLVDAKTLGPDDNLRSTFYLNQSAVYPLGYSIFTPYKEIEDAPGFWAHTIVFAYQDLATKDADSNDESYLTGGTPDSGWTYYQPGYSVIYMEHVRECALNAMQGGQSSFSIPAYLNEKRQLYKDWMHWTILHELGHAPSTASEPDDHGEEGLMKSQPATPYHDFTSTTVRRFREATQWNL